MPQPRNQSSKTSSDEQQLGFEYQYLYFILQLLKMEPGDIVGYEALDDVHVISDSNKKTTYIQVKHTVNTAAQNIQTTLPRLSQDFWNTLSNWSKIVSDPVEKRHTAKAQIAFLDNTQFVLVVNRRVDKNEVVTKINELRENKLSADAIKEYLSELETKTDDEKIRALIRDVKKLSKRVLVSFLKRISIVNTCSYLQSEICNYIRAKMIPDEYVDDVLCQLYTQLRKDFFDVVQNHQHQIITFDDWTKRYSSAFFTYRTTLLPFRQYHPPLPEHLEDQVFVKELVEIGAFDMSRDGLAEIAEFTRFYLDIQCQLDYWYGEGKITLDQLNRFHRDAKLTWKRIHQTWHRETVENVSLDNKNALSCFYEVIKEKLVLLSTALGLELSNGEFIKLANEKQIGWKYYWKGGSN